MSDPFRPDDELVSAVLDGEATADERARVEGDPTLSARLAEFRAVSGRVGAPSSDPTDAGRERAIAAAKAARPSPTTAPNVVPLSSRRAQDLPRFLAVAAAIVFVLGAAGFLIAQLDGRGDDGAGAGDAAARLDVEGADESSGGDSAEDSTTAGTGALSEEADDQAPDQLDGGTSSSATIRYLGAIEDEDQLVAALRGTGDFDPELNVPRPAPSTIPGDPLVLPQDAEGGSERCQAGLEERDPELNGLVDLYAAEYQGTPAIVSVYGTTGGGQRIIVVARDECRVLTTIDA